MLQQSESNLIIQGKVHGLNLISFISQVCPLLFVAGGYNVESEALDTSELVELCTASGKSCLEPANFPNISVYGGSSLKTPEGNPLLCGGVNNEGGCLEFLPESNSYEEGPELLGERVDSAYVQLADGRWWILSC